MGDRINLSNKSEVEHCYEMAPCSTFSTRGWTMSSVSSPYNHWVWSQCL